MKTIRKVLIPLLPKLFQSINEYCDLPLQVGLSPLQVPFAVQTRTRDIPGVMSYPLSQKYVQMLR